MTSFKFFIYILILILNFFVFYSHFGKSLSIFSYAFSFILILFIDNFILLPYTTIKKITQSRIDFNIKTAGLKHRNYKRILNIKIIVLTLIFCFTSYFQFKNEAVDFYKQALEYFKTPQAFVLVENELFPLKQYELTNINQDIKFYSFSNIKIKVVHAGIDKTWNLSLEDYSINLNSTKENHNEVVFSLSANTLFEKYSLNPTSFVLGHNNKQFRATFFVLPTPKPMVNLKQEQTNTPSLNHDTDDNLAFSVQVDSKIDLTQVILKIRTQSGFQFEQSLADFTNTSQKKFSLPYTEVPLAQIPFKNEDILFIKAVAKTPLLSITGESKELEFKIQKPPASAKKDNNKNSEQEHERKLQSTLELLEKQAPLDESWRKSILDSVIKLKKENNPAANAPLIDYLESRLR